MMALKATKTSLIKNAVKPMTTHANPTRFPNSSA